jgi:hypothetical protein
VDIEALIGLEDEVWNALVLGDAGADEALLAEDFVGVYPTGFAGRADHVRQLSDGPTVASYELSEPRMLTLSSSCVVLLYRADYVRVGDAGVGEAMYVSSIWELRADRWINVFSQDTPATGESVV